MIRVPDGDGGPPAPAWLDRTVWFVAGVSVGGIIALTLMPGSPAPYRFVADLMEPWLGARTVAFALNVLLFVPIGLVLGAVGRLRLLLLAPVASVAIELLQLLIPQRNADPWDVVANTAGAVLGYAIAAGVRHLVTRRATTDHRAPTLDRLRDDHRPQTDPAGPRPPA